MIHLALLLALAPQAPADHSALRGADTDAYVAISDIPAVLAAYADWPVAGLFDDPALAALLDVALGEEGAAGFQPSALLGSLWSALPLPAEHVDAVRAQAAHLTAASWSMTMPKAAGEAPGFLLALDFDGADPARAATALLLQVLEAGDAPQAALALSFPGQVQPTSGQLSQFQVPAIDDMFGAACPTWCWSGGQRVLIGGGLTSPEALQGVLSEAPGSLASASPYHRGGELFGAPAGPVVVDFFQSRGPDEMLAELSIDEADIERLGVLGTALSVAAELPFGLLDGTQRMRMQVRDGRVVTDVFQAHPPTAGPRLLRGRPLDPAWVAPVPDGVMAAYSAALDGQLLGATFRELATREGTEEQLAGLAAFEAGLGFPLEQVFGRLGPGMVIWMMPVSGLALPKTYAFVDLQDPAGFASDMAVVCEQIGEHLEGWRAKTRDYRLKDPASGERIKIPVTTFYPPDIGVDLGGLPISLNPSFAIQGDRLLVGLTPMAVKRELKRMVNLGADGEAPATLFASGRVDVPDGALSVTYMDWGALVGGLLNLAKTFGGMAAGFAGEGGGLPFDPSQIPGPEILEGHMEPTFRVVRAVDGGTHTRHEASFGPETWLTLAGGVMAATEAMGAMMGESAAAAFEPAEPEIRVVDHAGDTAAALGTLAVALSVYRMDHGGFPATLDQLTQPTEAFPGGFLDGQPVPADGWLRAFHYAPTADGNGYRLWSAGADGIDQSGAGDDVLRSVSP
jgi:hypothetical protein